jgi:protocatechuate 3,4-dioxygenase beta subunit
MINPDLTEPERLLTRRKALSLLGAAGLAAVAAACGSRSATKVPVPTVAGAPSEAAGSSPSGQASAPVQAVDCVLTPEQTEGPYYIADEAVRADITEGRPGTPLTLVLTVAQAGSCKVIPGATVEIWHADAGGNYSGFGATASNKTFLRGGQKTDAGGKATFKTIYPGWYQGRTVHIHVKVHAGGNVVHTGQLYFDEQTSNAVYAQAPYSSRGRQDTTNSQDGIYRSGGAASTLKLTKDGAGYLGTLTLGVKAA